MSILEYADYRTYLKQWIRSLPRSGRGEVNRIAKYLRVHPTLISQTLSGSRNLTEEQAYDLTEYIGLGEFEVDYFSLLVQMERAGSHKLKAHLKKKIAKLKVESLQISKRVKQDRKLNETENAVFYSSYLYSAIRLLCSLQDGQTVESIKDRFRLSRTRTQEILKFLTETGLCTESNGRYQIGPQITHLAHDSPLIAKHHANWRLQALQRSENLSQEELMFTGPLSISKSDFLAVREQLAKLIGDVSLIVRASKADEIACLNLDFFWVEPK